MHVARNELLPAYIIVRYMTYPKEDLSQRLTEWKPIERTYSSGRIVRT